MAQRVVQTQTDDVARLLLRRYLQVQVGGGEPNAFRDGARRVDDRAVPVEDDEGIAELRGQSALMTRSARSMIAAGMVAPMAFAVC